MIRPGPPRHREPWRTAEAARSPMATPKAGWIPPGYRSILDLVEEVGREIYGEAYSPDHPPPEFPVPPKSIERPLYGSAPGGSGHPNYTEADFAHAQANQTRAFLRRHWLALCERHREPARDQLRSRLAAGEIEAFVLSLNTDPSAPSRGGGGTTAASTPCGPGERAVGFWRGNEHRHAGERRRRRRCRARGDEARGHARRTGSPSRGERQRGAGQERDGPEGRAWLRDELRRTGLGRSRSSISRRRGKPCPG